MPGAYGEELKTPLEVYLGALGWEPWTMSWLSTLKAPGAELAWTPAISESVLLSTMPNRVTCPLFTTI